MWNGDNGAGGGSEVEKVERVDEDEWRGIKTEGEKERRKCGEDNDKRMHVE